MYKLYDPPKSLLITHKPVAACWCDHYGLYSLSNLEYGCIADQICNLVCCTTWSAPQPDQSAPVQPRRPYLDDFPCCHTLLSSSGCCTLGWMFFFIQSLRSSLISLCLVLNNVSFHLSQLTFYKFELWLNLEPYHQSDWWLRVDLNFTWDQMLRFI